MSRCSVIFGGDFEDSLSKLSLVIFLSLLQLIKHVFSKLFQIVFFLSKCEKENQNKMEIIGVTFPPPPLSLPSGPSKAKLCNLK